jgi:hypothetical protein
MRTLKKLAWVEMKLFVREPITMVFTFALPIIFLFVMGGVFGNTPDPEGNIYRGVGPMDYYVSAYIGLVMTSIGVVEFTKGEGRDKGLELVSVAVDTARLGERFNGKPAHYKLIIEAKTKTIAGAQIISEEIVSSTIDKMTIAVVCHMPLSKLMQIDSCYPSHVQEDQISYFLTPLDRLV